MGANLAVTKAPLTVTADAKTKVYGQSDPALTYVATGYQFTDNGTTVLTGSLSRVAGEDVGSYAITQGSLAANANYTISYVGANLAITKATPPSRSRRTAWSTIATRTRPRARPPALAGWTSAAN